MHVELAVSKRDQREISGEIKLWRENVVGGTRLKSLFKGRMGLGAAAVVADEPVMKDLEAWLLTFKAFHRRTPVVVICDDITYRFVTGLIRDWGLEAVTAMPHINADTEATIKERLVYVATESSYWKIVPIWWKIYALQQAIAISKGKGALVADSDIVFCRSITETYAADVVLSPFHWTDWGHTVIPRHGVFNAGFFMTREQRAAGVWMNLYQSGQDGFYEQKCLERFPGLFHCDYFGREHNHGIWRNVSPDQHTASVHIHTHTPPSYNNWGIYDHAMASLDLAKHLLKK